MLHFALFYSLPDPACQQGATASLHGSSLLHALQPHKVQPACMKLEPILQETGDLLVDEAAAEAAPVLQVSSLSTVACGEIAGLAC